MYMNNFRRFIVLMGLALTLLVGSFTAPAFAVGFLNGSDPDVILHKDPDGTGLTMGVNAATDDGVPNIGFSDGQGGGFETTFNDTVSSITILRGAWQFFDDSNYRGDTTGRLDPGSYNLGHMNDKITSAFRVAP